MASNLVLGILSIIFGIAVLALPKLLRYVIGGYFILVGILMLL